MGRYQRLPSVLEAHQWDGTEANAIAIANWAGALPPVKDGVSIWIARNGGDVTLVEHHKYGTSFIRSGWWVLWDEDSGLRVDSGGRFQKNYAALPTSAK